MQHSNFSTISANGGLNLLISHLYNIGFWQELDKSLGKRHKRAQYSYGDIFLTWTMNILCGANRLEQTIKNRDQMLSHPRLKKGISPDTITRAIKHFAVENTYYTQAKRETQFKNKRHGWQQTKIYYLK